MKVSLVTANRFEVIIEKVNYGVIDMCESG